MRASRLPLRRLMSTAPPSKTPSAAAAISTMQLYRDVLKHVWPANNPATKLRVAASVGMLAGAKVSMLTVPFLFKSLVDSVTGTEQQLILGAGSAVFLYGFARASASALTELRDVVFAKVAQDAVRAISLETFMHLHALDLRWHLSRQTGAVTRIVDRGTRSIDNLLRSIVFRVVPTGLELCLVTGALATTCGPAFAALSALTLTMYTAFTVAVTSWRTQFRKEMNAQEASAATRAIDSLLNYETVKFFGNEAHEAAKYNDALLAYQKAVLKTQASLGILNFGQSLIFSVGLSGMMWLALDGIRRGTMTVGDLVLVNGLLAQLALPLNFVGMVYRETTQSIQDMKEMYALRSQHPAVTDSPTAVPLVIPAGADVPAIEFDHVAFTYGARGLLHDVSFKVMPGQTVALVGPSGCGKSTVLRLLFRFFDAEHGSVRVFGQDVRDVTMASLRQAMAVVPQDTVLFNASLFQNLHYGNLAASKEAVVEAARLAQLERAIERMPRGLDTLVGERGLKLSGGERQRVSIARSLLKNAPILLCDEATSALDGRTEADIMSSLKLLARSKTTVLVAHRLASVKDADVICVMHEGRVVEAGTHSDLLALPLGKYRAMWALQDRHDHAATPAANAVAAAATTTATAAAAAAATTTTAGK